MTMKKLLGISLALVMLIGSVPLGFSEPLRVQLEQGIETNQIQCDNPEHVLVLRTNGNAACVTERTAERTGWEIIMPTIIDAVISKENTDTLIAVSDDRFTASAESNELAGMSGICADGFPRDVSVDMPRMVKNGESFEVTVSYTFVKYTQEYIDVYVIDGIPVPFKDAEDYDTPFDNQDRENSCGGEILYVDHSDKISFVSGDWTLVSENYHIEQNSTTIRESIVLEFSEDSKINSDKTIDSFSFEMVVNEPLNPFDGRIWMKYDDSIEKMIYLTGITYGEDDTYIL